MEDPEKRPKSTTNDAEQRTQIFDVIRKKNVALTPEEAVRQHLITWFINTIGIPQGLIALERGIEVYGRKKRFDVVVFNRAAQPVMLVECKAPGVAFTDAVYQQAGQYLKALPACWVVLYNGDTMRCFHGEGDEKMMAKPFPEYPFWMD